MEDQQRVRLIILSVSGLLFGAGGYGYYWYQEQKAASQAETEQVVSVRPAVRKPVKPQTIATASTVTTSGAGADSAASTKLAVQTTPATNNDKPGAATADGAPASNATKPAVAITTAPVTAPPAANIKPTTAQPVQPVASAPPTQPATSPAAAPGQNKAQTAAIPAAKPVVARAVTAQVPAATQTAPTPVATTSAPATTATAAAPATANGATGQAATPAVAPPAVTKNSKHYPATTQEYALAMAAIGKGRQNPVEPNGSYKQWPLNTRAMNKDDDSMVPPPPLDSPEEKIKPAPTKIKNEKLVPPPPPMQATPTSTLANDPLGGIDISQLPPPPSRPTIGDKVKVLAVFDDKAIISFPRAMLQKNHWPRTITLAKGEQFESLTVVSIDRDGVTFEEDGERSLKPIATIK